MGNNPSLTRALNLIKSKFLPPQSPSLIQKIEKPLIPRQLILYNRVTALVPIMRPHRGRAAKTAAANSIASKSKQEKNEESDVEADEEMAVDVKKQSARGKKKENGHEDKPKARGRKKAEQEEEVPEEMAKASSGKGKKKGKDEGQDEPEVRKSGRAKKKEAPKEEANATEEEEPPKKVARGRKKVEPVENGESVEEPSKPLKGRKKAEEKPEKTVKRGKKGKAEEEADENGVEEEMEEKEEKQPKRGKKGAKEAQNADEEEEEKPLVKRGRKPKESKPEETKQEEKFKAKAKGKRVNDEETDSAAKKTKPEEKKTANKVDTNLDEIDFTCDKPNAKGDKYNFKICSWNVAGIRAMQNKQGIEYILKEDADVVVLQETKCDADKIPKAWELPGYKRFYVDSSSKSGYAGVALYSKKEPIDVKYGLDKEFDDEGRLITVEFEGFYVLNVYVPNTGRGLVNMDKRMEWNETFKKYLKELDEKKPVILCGDMNVAHQEIDLANPKTNTKNAGFTKEERDGMTDFLAAGFVDTFRQLYPDKTGAYTFWSNMRDSRSKNVGWRLDYFVVSERIKDNVCDNVMRSNVYGSDHCPIVLYVNL